MSKLNVLFVSFVCVLINNYSQAQVYLDLSNLNYTQSFLNWNGYPAEFQGLSIQNPIGINIPNPTKITTSSVSFSNGSMGGIQNTTSTEGNIQMLATGSVDNTNSVAFDLKFNLGSVEQGVMSFSLSTVFNSIGNRRAVLKLYYSIDGVSWFEISSPGLPYEATNSVANSTNIQFPLPPQVLNESNVTFRFYCYNSPGGGSGSRPKIGIDNILLTKTLVIGTQNQNVNVQNIGSFFNCSAGVNVFGSSDSNLPLSFATSNNNIAVIENGQLIPISEGEVNLLAYQTGNSEYLPSLLYSQKISVLGECIDPLACNYNQSNCQDDIQCDYNNCNSSENRDTILLVNNTQIELFIPVNWNNQGSYIWNNGNTGPSTLVNQSGIYSVKDENNPSLIHEFLVMNLNYNFSQPITFCSGDIGQLNIKTQYHWDELPIPGILNQGYENVQQIAIIDNHNIVALYGANGNWIKRTLRYSNNFGSSWSILASPSGGSYTSIDVNSNNSFSVAYFGGGGANNTKISKYSTSGILQNNYFINSGLATPGAHCQYPNDCFHVSMSNGIYNKISALGISNTSNGFSNKLLQWGNYLFSVETSKIKRFSLSNNSWDDVLMSNGEQFINFSKYKSHLSVYSNQRIYHLDNFQTAFIPFIEIPDASEFPIDHLYRTNNYSDEIWSGNKLYYYSNLGNFLLDSIPVGPKQILNTNKSIYYLGGNDTLYYREIIEDKLEIKWMQNGTYLGSGRVISYEDIESGYLKMIIEFGSQSFQDSVLIIRNELPLIDLQYSNQLPICPGEVIQVSAASSNIASYQWTFNNINIFDNQASSVTISNSGNYLIQVTDNNGCNSILPFEITSYDPVTLNLVSQGVQFLCPEEVKSIGFESNENLSFEWFRDNIALTQSISSIIDVSTSGYYFAMVTDEHSCESLTDSISVLMYTVINPQIIGSYQNLNCNGQIVSVGISPDIYSSINWYSLNNDQISNANNAQITTPGGYYAVCMDNNNCTRLTDTISILFIQNECNDVLSCSYSPEALCVNNNLCTYSGCTNPSACNFNPSAGCDDGSCLFPGCTDSNACNFNPLSGCSDGSCSYAGCTDPSACNFNPTAGCDNGSCHFTNTTCNDNNANTILDSYNASCNCIGIPYTYGTIASNTNTICPEITSSSFAINNSPTGMVNYSLQWYFKTGNNSAPTGASTSGWNIIQGATASSLSVDAFTGTRTYACFVIPDASYGISGSWMSGAKVLTYSSFAAQTIIGNPNITPFNAYNYIVNPIPLHTYSWSVTNGAIASGQSTNNVSIMWGQNGPYQLTLTESNGTCSGSSYLFAVNNNCSISVSAASSTTNTFCAGTTLQLQAATSATGITYQWYLNGTLIPNETNQNISVSSGGNYQVSINQNGCTAVSNIVSINQLPSAIIPNILVEQANAGCVGGEATLIVSGGTYTNLLWNNGLTASSINVNASGDFSITAIDENGCAVSAGPVSVNFSILDPVPVCIVTVDQVTGKNNVIWEPVTSDLINLYVVLKETNVANEYAQIGTVAYGSNGIFEDLNSDPQIQANRYKLALIDTCGILSSTSNFHKTIHLTANQGLGSNVNLIWSEYEGFDFGSYSIYRGSSASSLNLLTTIASNLNSFTDVNPPFGETYYMIEVAGVSCDPQRTLVYSHSNILDSTVGIEEFTSTRISLYPNPASTSITLQVNTPLIGEEYVVFDAIGKVIYKNRIQSTNELIQLENFNNGNYFIKVNEVVKRFVVQK